MNETKQHRQFIVSPTRWTERAGGSLVINVTGGVAVMKLKI